LLEKGDNEELERYSHTLKSTSAAIGASRVSKQFSILEDVFNSSDTANINDELTDLDVELAATQHQLKIYLNRQEMHVVKNEASTSDESTAPLEISKEELLRLTTLIEAYDVEAKSIVTDLIERFPYRNQQLADLAQYLEDYDFEQALDVVQQWLDAY
jgi:HPt (histidine-containing phosphotransfer) domain-containing protein